MMKKSDDINGTNPFRVPENYFEEVNSKIISSASGIGKDPAKISIFSRFRTGILVAASFTGLLLISYTAIRLFTTNKTNTQFSEVFREINTETLIYDIDVSSLEENATSIGIPEDVPDVPKKDIIDYLLLENIELNDIYAKF
jgi:hypothetical protein